MASPTAASAAATLRLPGGPDPERPRFAGFGAALIGSLIYSVLGIVIDSALQRLFPNQ
mgnify:CR=1 FL=1